MRLTLIRPNMGRMAREPYVDEGRMEPLQLGLIAAMCPPDVDVELVDDRCEPIPYDAPTDLVALTVETFTARRAYEIAAEYRMRRIPVVFGGFHPTLLPDEAARYADCIVTGDAEPIWPDLLADARAGRLRPSYAGAPDATSPDRAPRRELFRNKGYLPITLSQFGRGCPHGCSFCAVSAFAHRQHRVRAVESVVQELQDHRGRLVFFVDDNIVANPLAAKDLFRALIPLGLRWVSQGTVAMADDPELMELMCESGCLGHVIGFESTNPGAMKEAGKTAVPDIAARHDRVAETLRRYGLQTWAAFTLGYDSDTPESLRELLDFSLRHRFAFAAFNILMPYPGTPFYEKLRRENRLLYDGAWWLHPDYRFNHAAFRPAQMTPEELTRVAFDIRSRWNSLPSLLHRFLDLRTNMASLRQIGIYWIYNALFRRETFKKQGMSLGCSTATTHGQPGEVKGTQ